MSIFKTRQVHKNKRDEDLLVQIVRWLHANPSKCVSTSVPLMSRTMAVSVNFGSYGKVSTDEILLNINKLIRRKILLREQEGFHRYNFKFNYEHPDLISVYGIVPVEKHISDKVHYVPIPDRVAAFIKDNPLKCYKCTVQQLAHQIVEKYSFSDSLGGLLNESSVSAVIRRMAKKGDIIKAEKNSSFKKFEYTFKLAQEPDEDVSPDTDYEVLKCNKTPEEEKEITKESVGPFKGLAETWAHQPHEIFEEPKENKSLVQEIALPDGRTLNLTININFGK